MKFKEPFLVQSLEFVFLTTTKLIILFSILILHRGNFLPDNKETRNDKYTSDETQL